MGLNALPDSSTKLGPKHKVSIYKRKSGRWAVMIDVEDPHPFRIVGGLQPTKGGRRRTKILGRFKTQLEAEKELARLSKGYEAALSIERLARGRRKLGTFKTKREAEQAERDALSARDRGSDVVPSRLTVGALFELFMKDAEAARSAGRPCTATGRFGSVAIGSQASPS
jgi:hypothetical protein